MNKFVYGVLLLLTAHVSTAQVNAPLEGLHDWLQSNKPRGLDTTRVNITYMPNGNLNYLYPLYQLYHEQKKYSKILPDNGYADALSEAVAFCQDYESALYYQQQNYSGDPDEVSKRQIAKVLSGFKKMEQVDARRYISFVSRSRRVIMINEAHNKPLHRAFTISLLEDLYHRGYRYLAMEMFNNFSNHDLDKLTPKTGHFCTEPVAGELIRIALHIGYTLVSYDDTAAFSGPHPHSARERDSIQASNICKILQKDTSAKILVHASYAAVAKRSVSPQFVSMAMALKQQSGIDPLTVDQTEMTEEGSFSYGKYFYKSYIEKFQPSSPSIALIDEQPVDVTGSGLFDLTVIHPPTTYRDARPTWLSLGGRRQPLYVKAQHKTTFMVQAYYQLESFGAKPGEVIPADQTYIPASNGNYLLYLQRGKYIILFRDIEYRMINTQHIEVN